MLLHLQQPFLLWRTSFSTTTVSTQCAQMLIHLHVVWWFTLDSPDVVVDSAAASLCWKPVSVRFTWSCPADRCWGRKGAISQRKLNFLCKDVPVSFCHTFVQCFESDFINSVKFCFWLILHYLDLLVNSANILHELLSVFDWNMVSRDAVTFVCT